jgi:hypothetical protein
MVGLSPLSSSLSADPESGVLASKFEGRPAGEFRADAFTAKPSVFPLRQDPFAERTLLNGVRQRRFRASGD